MPKISLLLSSTPITIFPPTPFAKATHVLIKLLKFGSFDLNSSTFDSLSGKIYFIIITLNAPIAPSIHQLHQSHHYFGDCTNHNSRVKDNANSEKKGSSI